MAGVARHLGNEGAVDLDLVEREPPQIGQAGIGRAEVVHGDAHAQVSSAACNWSSVAGGVAQQRASVISSSSR